jgi:tRNA-specific 2-thiouridylase
MKLKIAVAMSGGVDSSTAAALLKDEGNEVIGLTMRLVEESHSALEDARKICEILGIEHKVAEFRDIFDREIINYFNYEYSAGRTPNPCVLCNRLIKFGALWEQAAALGAEYLATGHYARIERTGNEVILKKGLDAKKDQSYFLCRLSREQIKHTVFPLGGMTKTQVKQIAREKGLPAASRPESQDICFIPHIERASMPGPVIDRRGHVLGKHHGIATYTVGQRHGLGIAAAEPLYVTALEPSGNAIIVGTKEETYSSDLIASDVSWISGKMPKDTSTLKAKVRYHQAEAPISLSLLDEEHYYVKYYTPQMAITPGQTIAFYNEDTVLGGGTILKQGDRL